MPKENSQIIFGLERSDDHVVLAQLRRATTGWIIEKITHADHLNDLAIPNAIKNKNARLAVLMPDQHVLYRRLELPRADDANLAAMVAAQAQTILPQSGEALDSAWLKLGAPDQHPTQPLLIGAARHDAVQRLRDQTHDSTHALIDVTTGAAALDALCQHQGVTLTDAPTAIVRVSQAATLLCLYDQQKLVAAASIDFDLTPTDEASVASWSREIAEAFEQCAAPLAFATPQVGLLIADQNDHNRLNAALASALRCAIQKSSLSDQLNPARLSKTSTAAGAIGAALALADQSQPNTLYSDVNPDAPILKPINALRPRRLIAAAVWALLMLLALYQIDRQQAQQLETALADAKRLTQDLGGLDGRIQLLTYIEKHATTPALPIMQEVSRLVPKGTILSDYNYDRDGRVRFTGYVSSASALDDFTAKLTASPLFKSVDVPSAKYNERSRRWDYQINAMAVPLTLYAVHQAKTKQVTAAEKTPLQKDTPEKPHTLDKTKTPTPTPGDTP